MPKPNWGWFMVAVLATITCVYVLNLGFGTTSSGRLGTVILIGVTALAMWGFYRAFFNFRRR